MTSPGTTGLVARIVRWVSAIVLVLVGLVLSIPGIPGPGLLLVALGLFVLLPESRWLQRRYARLKRRYPRAFAVAERKLRRRRRRNGGRRGSRGRAA